MFSGILGKLLGVILVLALVDLVFVNWWIVKSQKPVTKSQVSEINLRDNNAQNNKDSVIEASPTNTPSSSPATTQPNTQTVVETKTFVEKQTQTVVQTAQKEIFVPMGSGSTKSQSFADLAGAEVSIDTTKYTSIDYIVFEASIWVEGGNGKIWAQIKNVGDNNPIIESQIISTSSTPEGRASGKIPIPSGAKTYRVQAKTAIENVTANVSNARLKIVLK